MQLVPAILTVSILFGAAAARAEQPQALSADVDGKAFVSDDDSILLVPVAGTFTLMASTKGAAAYPPPKTPIDRLSVTCDDPKGKPVRFDSQKFANRNACRASFEKGEDKAAGVAEVEYELDTSSKQNFFEISAVTGKVYEGTFQFSMKAANGAKLTITSGKFKAEDRQL